jgi:parvulin-like peptidyl-prolyl isomerase
MQNFKVKRLSLIMICLIVASQSMFAATSSFGKPAAIIKFNGQTMAVTTDELDTQYAQVKDIAEQQGLTEAAAKQQVLEGIIDNKLFAAAAKRDGIVADDDTVNKLFANQKTVVEKSAGRSITEDQYEDMIIQSVGSVDAYKEYLSSQYVLQQYITKMKGQEIQNAVVQPTDVEVTNFFRQEKTKFINPETVNVAQVFIPFKDNDTNTKSEATLNDLVKKLRAGSISWNDAVAKYSTNSNGKVDGDIGWITLDDTQNVKTMMGLDFFNTAFETEVGQVSDVVKSTAGYHILKVKKHIDAKLLSIDDPISPADTMTVRQYIINTLAQQNAQAAYNSAIKDLSNSLRDQATITKLI